MRSHLRLYFLIITMLFSIVGCKSIPADNQKKGFLANPPNGTGRVLITAHYVPIEMSVIRALIGEGVTGFHPTVYDVTENTQYLGTIVSSGSKIDSTWIEFDAKPGKHILMLHDYVSFTTEVVDFIEVTITPGEIQHVAISQYGGSERPFFAKIDIDQTAYDFCTKKLPRTEPKFLKGYTALDEFIKEHNIPNKRGAFRSYCISLGVRGGGPTVRYPNETSGLDELEMQKVEAARVKGLPKWESLQDRTPPYDLLNEKSNK